MQQYQALIKKAFEAKENAYCPYSGFAVGAALLSADGRIFTGCNIENSNGTSNCAERTAFFKAVSEGIQDFQAIALVGGGKGELITEGSYCYPCGACRQVMAEFCKGSFLIISAVSTDDYKIHTLNELLPYAFSLDNKKCF